MSSEFRLGVDIEIHTDDEEVEVQNVRVKKIENLEELKNLKKISIINSCVDKIEGISENKKLQHFEIYQVRLFIPSSGYLSRGSLRV